jgi:type I restriction enzyme, S subunit
MNHEIHVGSSLPPGWDAFSLGSKASFVTSGSRGWARFYSESGDLFLRSQNIRSGHLDLEDRQHVLPPAGAEGERTRVQPNDLLVTITGNSVGNVAISSDDLGIAYISQHVGMIRLANPSLAPYACWYLSPGAPGNRQIMDAQTGQSKPGLNLQNLKDLVVAAPKDKRERDLIVAALDDIQAQADEIQMLLSKKRMLKQAAMQELLTGKRRLPGFEGEWELKRLGDHVRFLRNGVNSRAELQPEGRIRYLHYGDIHASSDSLLSPEQLASLPVTKAAGLDRLQNGDLIFADASEDIAGVSRSVELCGISDYEAVSGLHTIAARFDKAVLANGFKGFLQYVPSFSAHLRRLAAGTKVYATNRAHISSAEVRLPPVAEQKAIADVLIDMSNEIGVLRERMNKACTTKRGMMQQLLTGKIRLR